jgi:hypothetical protein
MVRHHLPKDPSLSETTSSSQAETSPELPDHLEADTSPTATSASVDEAAQHQDAPDPEAAGATGEADEGSAPPEEAPDPYEGAVPPGYDWPTHGGYLGCLMGVIVACLLGGFLGSLLVGVLSLTPLSVLVGTPVARILIIAGVFVATVFFVGRLGWALGKRFYREYPQPAARASQSESQTTPPHLMP